MGIANTGTGKTGAFLIPLINKVRLDRKQQVLIIAPTRELAIQIDSELKGFTAGMKIYSVCVVGGMSIGRQISELRYQYNFIIGTPGPAERPYQPKNDSPFWNSTRWSWTKRTGCWIWDSLMKCVLSWRGCPKKGRPCFSRRRFLRRLRN